MTLLLIIALVLAFQACHLGKQNAATAVQGAILDTTSICQPNPPFL